MGVALVALDFRTYLPDLFPDPLGWLFVAWGAWRLRLRLAAAAAGLAVVLSASDFALPYREVCVDRATGDEVDVSWEGCPLSQRWDTVSDVRAMAIAGAVLAGGVALWRLLDALQVRASAKGQHQIAQQLLLLQLAVAVTSTLPTLVLVAASLMLDERYDPVWNGNVEYVALAGLASLTYLVVVLVQHRDRAFAVEI